MLRNRVSDGVPPRGVLIEMDAIAGYGDSDEDLPECEQGATQDQAEVQPQEQSPPPPPARTAEQLALDALLADRIKVESTEAMPETTAPLTAAGALNGPMGACRVCAQRPGKYTCPKCEARCVHVRVCLWCLCARGVFDPRPRACTVIMRTSVLMPPGPAVWTAFGNTRKWTNATASARAVTMCARTS